MIVELSKVCHIHLSLLIIFLNKFFTIPIIKIDVNKLINGGKNDSWLVHWCIWNECPAEQT